MRGLHRGGIMLDADFPSLFSPVAELDNNTDVADTLMTHITVSPEVSY